VLVFAIQGVATRSFSLSQDVVQFACGHTNIVVVQRTYGWMNSSRQLSVV
jgi:hypothetical protein